MSARPAPAICDREGPLTGALDVPGDKSISHRALLFGALATSPSRVTGLLDAADVRATRAAVEQLGARVREEHGALVVEPPERLAEPAGVLDCGNSGTALRLLCGVLAGVPGLAVLTGDASLRQRPVRRVLAPLARMGAEVAARAGGALPPVAIRGGSLRGLRHELEVASAQVKSAILIAGLGAEGETTVVEPARSRDHTERMLARMGAALIVNGREVTIRPGRPRGVELAVPGDLSSAAFFLAAAAMVPGSRVTVRNVGVNPTRAGVLEVLAAMGARVERANERESGGEPVADVTVSHAELRGVEIAGELVPRLIDELPVLMVAATQAQGATVVRDAAELRVKESDRLASMGEALARAGAKVELFPDGCRVDGPVRLRGCEVATRMDHRVAMSMAVAQLAASGPVTLDDVGFVGTSFPTFFALLDRLCAGGAA